MAYLRKRSDRITNHGYCPCCGFVQTHDIQGKGKRNKKRVPLHNMMVYHGTCVRCTFMLPLFTCLLGGGASYYFYYYGQDPEKYPPSKKLALNLSFNANANL